MNKIKAIIVGKLPPPYYGTTIWSKTIIDSKLKEEVDTVFFDVNIHKSIRTLGKISIDKIFKNISLYFKLFFALRKNKPDIVLIPISQETIGFLKDSFFILISSFFNCKRLVILHGSNIKNWLGSSSRITNWYVRYTLSRTHGVIVLGNNLRHLFEDYYPIEKIYVVPNGLNISYNSIKTKKDSFLRLIYLGNLQESKGILDLLNGLTYIDKNILHNIKLTVVGNWYDNKTKEYSEKLVDKYNLPVFFNGPAYGDEKYKILSESDIFIFTPKLPEGHPLVIIEAMALGLPIITTNQGAICESVIDGFNGYIVNVSAPEQIAKKIELFFHNNDIVEEFGRKGRLLYEGKFTEDIMIRNLINVFNDVYRS